MVSVPVVVERVEAVNCEKRSTIGLTAGRPVANKPAGIGGLGDEC